ncbi:MAG: hypothetical protein EGS41_08455 [Prevotella sp.]|nr:hypothetical protein [Prevotella sp.]
MSWLGIYRKPLYWQDRQEQALLVLALMVYRELVEEAVERRLVKPKPNITNSLLGKTGTSIKTERKKK